IRFLLLPTAIVRPLSSLAKFSFVISNIRFPPGSGRRGRTATCLPAHYACRSLLNKIVLILRRACGVIVERKSAEEHRHQRTGAGQYIRLPPWCWRSLHRAQASGADRRRACPATGDIPALA